MGVLPKIEKSMCTNKEIRQTKLLSILETTEKMQHNATNDGWIGS
jgi:hypothetical protein